MVEEIFENSPLGANWSGIYLKLARRVWFQLLNLPPGVTGGHWWPLPQSTPNSMGLSNPKLDRGQFAPPYPYD